MMSDTEHQGNLAEYDENELVFHADGQITRKQLLLAGGAAALSGPLLFSSVAEAKIDAAGIHLPYKANTGAKGTLDFWHFWSSPLRRGAIHSAIKQFQSVYKNVHVNDLPVPFGDIYNKLYAAVAAQSGVPDVVVANRPNFWVDAKHNVYIDLSGYNAKDKVSSKAFYPFTWKQCNVSAKGKNHLYGLPFETDIRVLYINRAALVDAGYSANTAPKTWSQLSSMASKLDQKKGSQYSVITFWPEIGGSLALDTLIWLNGGSWENSKGAPTVNASKNVATGDWMRSWADRYGGMSAYNALNAQSNAGVDMFASGLQVFHMDQPTYQDFTLVQHGVQFHPKNGKNLFPYWNVSYLPVGPSGKHPYSFSGGFAIGVPRKKQRNSASTEAAWEFTKFMALVGQLTFERFAGNIPAVPSMAHDPALSAKPHWSSFIAALKYGHAGDADKYDELYPDDVVVPAQNDIMNGRKSAKQALDAAQQQALTNMKRNGGP